MKQVAKIFKITVILVVSVLFVLFSISLIMQNKVAGLVLNSLNNNFSTKIETGSSRLSLIRKFPKASIELKDVVVHSSPGFDHSGFPGINTDTLLTAESASVDFKMIDMLRKAYTFENITVRSGKIFLFTDKSGNTNYDVSKNKDVKSENDNITLNLNKINLTDLGFVYNDLRPELIIEGRFKDGHMKSKLRNNNIDFEGKSETLIDFFKLGKISLKYTIPADLEIGLNRNEKGIFFRKSTLGIEGWDFILNGFIASDDYLDLNISAADIDISKLPELIPEKYRKPASQYHPEGTLKFDCTIKGKSTSSQNPHYEIKWTMKNARVDNIRSDLKIDNFSFEGFFTNGTKNRPETSSLTISNFTTRLGSADFKGSFSFSDFSDPVAELKFTGKIFPAELKEFLNLRNVSRAAGSIDLDLRFYGSPGKKGSFKPRDIFTLNSQSEAIFNSVELAFKDKPIDIKDLNGRLLIRETTTTDNFRLTLNNHKIKASGNLINFPGWLTGNLVNLEGTATVTASSLMPESFMHSRAGTELNAKDSPGSAPVNLPDNINLEMNFNLDTLIYKTFNARHITGILSIRPKMMNFRSISLNSQKGHISGNGLVVQNRDKSFMGRGSFTLTGVDVNEAFNTFNNFGQSFLKAENIAGSLSGTITLALPVDSLLNPDVRSVTAEGKYSLTDGALINFDPVKALSSFIELSELENIKFEKLENDFFIRNNVFYIPQMDIKSSAAGLSVNGIHSFDNDYEYHVKMLLSELLSKKARKKRNPDDEFGEVEDDGLGRTSIYLRITGKGDEVKVGYDRKAAEDQIIENIRKEKQTLKTIFNEEYRLYKTDPIPEKREGSRPRFRIMWEGSDTTEVTKEPPAQKKENIIRKLFKKI